MGIVTVILIAIGLAMDCFAVSLTTGVCVKNIRIAKTLQIAFFFGFFQAIMPVIGWLLGMSFSKIVSNYDHWIAFVLLCVIGIKMIIEALKHKDEKCFNISGLWVVITLSVATSIDALIIGMGFAFIDINIVQTVAIIGAITFIISIIGVYLGKTFNKLDGKWAEIFGGIILILIGFKILFEHLAIISF